MVLGLGLEYQRYFKAPIDADWSTAEQKAHMKELLLLISQLRLVGGGDSTYQNRKQAKKELYRETVTLFIFNNLKIGLISFIK